MHKLYAIQNAFHHPFLFVFLCNCAVEELERQHTIKLRLGYQPEAAPPDLANVKSRINNKHTKNAGKKPTKGALTELIKLLFTVSGPSISKGGFKSEGRGGFCQLPKMSTEKTYRMSHRYWANFST